MLVMALSGLFLVPAHSQATSKRNVEYGKAVSELIKLGFPDVKGARYVKLKDQNLEYVQGSFSSVDRTKRPSLSGNGFYISNEDKSKPERFITLNGVELVYLKKRGNPSNSQGANYYGGASVNVSGKMKAADLKKDIGAIQEWALKQTLDSSFSYNGTEYYSMAFGFANLAYQSGMKNEANKLIKTLFLNHENPEKIIDKLISNLAKNEYKKVYAEFNTKQDWANYHAGLLRIQEKYPRGWDNHPGLAILIPLVKKRVDKEPVAIPTIEGHTFSDEIKDLIGKTAEVPKKARNEYYGDSNLFLIDKVAKNNKAPAMRQLTQYGMDGFIALVALIGDDTLVVGNQNNNYSSYSYSRSYDDEGKSAEDAYSALTKPQTRGQMAEQIVRGTLPHNYQELSEVQGDQLKTLAIQWWKKHKNDEQFALIKHYLEHGNQSHTSTLSRNLINQNTKESRELLEHSILNSERPENLSELVKTYVKKRRVRAKDFIIKYQDILLARIGESTDQSGEFSSYQIVQAGGTRKYIASLLLYTEELKPDKLFENLAKKGSNTNEIMDMLGSVYSGGNISKVMSKFIHIAAESEDTKKQTEILGSLYRMIFAEDEQPINAEVANIKDAPEKVSAVAVGQIEFTEAEKKDWKKLLTSDVRAQYMSNSDITGMLLDKYIHPERTGQDYQPMSRLGQEVVSEVIKARSEKFLEGEKAEPLPNLTLVSEDRKKEVLANLSEIEPIKFREMYEALNYSERILVVYDPISQVKFKEARVYIKGFRPQNNKAKDKIKNTDQLEKLMEPLLNKRVSAEMYTEFSKIVLDNIELFVGVSVSPQPSWTLPGRDVHFMKSSSSHFPIVKKATEDLVAGKRDSFVTVVAFPNGGGRGRSSGQQPLIFIFDKQSPPEPKKLEEITDSHSMTITAVTKEVIDEWKKNQVDGKEQVINELIKFQPSLEDMRSRLNEMPLDKLQEALDQMTGNR